MDKLIITDDDIMGPWPESEPWIYSGMSIYYAVNLARSNGKSYILFNNALFDVIDIGRDPKKSIIWARDSWPSYRKYHDLHSGYCYVGTKLYEEWEQYVTTGMAID